MSPMFLPRLSALPFALAAAIALSGCGGGAGGSGDPSAAPAATAAALTGSTLVATLSDLTATATSAGDTPGDTPAAWRAPALPAPGLGPGDLAVLIAEGDPLSEAIGLTYQRARGIPDAHMIRLPLATDSDVISAVDFAQLKATLDQRLPATAQATLVTWTRPSRVQGACQMGLTSALALGYNTAHCCGCSRTQASAYYDSDSARPHADLGIRPSMMLGATTLAAAQALIDRGLAADGSAPAGTGYLVRTADAARSVRHTDFAGLPAAWSAAPGLDLRAIDASAAGTAQTLVGASDVLFYFTGLAQVADLGGLRFLPGAAADHLTSFGGLLPDGRGQMPATAWLAAGATASYGTVEEPCNHLEKFPRASVLIEHYLRGATLIEAYWKSVAWPGQGLFVGEPLARPWNQPPQARIENGALVVRSRSLRRGARYRAEYRPSAASPWQTLGELTAGQPQPLTWRLPLPASTPGGQLRWLGPCPASPASTCVLAQPA